MILVGTSGRVYPDWEERFCLYFNNDPEGHAIGDAQRLMALLGLRA